MKKLGVRAIYRLDVLKEKASKALEALELELRSAHDKAEEYYYDRSDKWIDSEKGEAFNDWVSDLDYKADEVETMKDDVFSLDLEEIETPEEA